MKMRSAFWFWSGGSWQILQCQFVLMMTPNILLTWRN